MLLPKATVQPSWRTPQEACKGTANKGPVHKAEGEDLEVLPRQDLAEVHHRPLPAPALQPPLLLQQLLILHPVPSSGKTQNCLSVFTFYAKDDILIFNFSLF